MPKLLHSAPSLRHHKPSGQAVVTLSGKDHYLGRFGTKQAERNYERIIGQWLAANRNLPPGDEADDAGVDIAEFSVDYLEYARDYDRKNGTTTGEYLLARLVHKRLKHTYGKQSAKSFGPLAFKAYPATFFMTQVKVARLKRAVFARSQGTFLTQSPFELRIRGS